MKLSFLLFNIKFVGFGKFVWSLIGFTRTAMVYFHGLKLYTTNITATYICVHPIINSQVLCRYLRQHKQRNFVAYNLTRHLHKYGYAWVRRGVFPPNPHWSDRTYQLNILWLCWKEASRLIVLTNPDMLFCSSYIFIYCFWHNLLQVVGMGFLLRILFVINLLYVAPLFLNPGPFCNTPRPQLFGGYDIHANLDYGFYLF